MKQLIILALTFALLGCFACTKKPDTGATAAPAAEAGDALPSDLMALFNTPMSADEALAAAKEARVVVMESVKVTSGREVWNEFFERTEAGEKAAVLTAKYYTLDPERVDPALYAQEKDNYPVLYFTLITYDGDLFEYTVKDSKTAGTDSSGRYLFLKHYEGKLRQGAAFDAYDRYELVNDENVTWEELEWGMFSSQFGDYIPFHTAYCDFYDND